MDSEIDPAGSIIPRALIRSVLVSKPASRCLNHGNPALEHITQLIMEAFTAYDEIGGTPCRRLGGGALVLPYIKVISLAGYRDVRLSQGFRGVLLSGTPAVAAIEALERQAAGGGHGALGGLLIQDQDQDQGRRAVTVALFSCSLEDPPPLEEGEGELPLAPCLSSSIP